MAASKKRAIKTSQLKVGTRVITLGSKVLTLRRPGSHQWVLGTIISVEFDTFNLFPYSVQVAQSAILLRHPGEVVQVPPKATKAQLETLASILGGQYTSW